MAVTRLDWDVLPRGSNRLVSFPWITGHVRKGDAYTVLFELCRRFNREVETIIPAHSWGHAPRPVRGGTSHSEHSAGTAIDLNAPAHPLGRRNTFSKAQKKAIKRILKDLDGSVRWGGNYLLRADDMHFELKGGVKKLAAVARKIQGSSPAPSRPAVPNPVVPKPKPKPVLVRSDGSIRRICLRVTKGTAKRTTAYLTGLYQRQQWDPFGLVHDNDWGVKTDAHYRWVGQLQKRMNKWTGKKVRVDGDYRRESAERVLDIQIRNLGYAYKGKPDGIAGPVFCKMLGIKNYPN